jgi:hypothetical protein
LGNLAHPGGGGTQVLAFGVESATIQAAFQQQGFFLEVQFV